MENIGIKSGANCEWGAVAASLQLVQASAIFGSIDAGELAAWKIRLQQINRKRIVIIGPNQGARGEPQAPSDWDPSPRPAGRARGGMTPSHPALLVAAGAVDSRTGS